MTMKDSTYLSHLVRRIKWSDIDEKYVAELVKTARAEDIEGAGLAVLPKVAADITTRSLTPSIKTSAALCARRDMVVCGMELVRIVLKVYEEASDDFECKFTPLAKDGDKVSKGAKLGVIEGSARVILQAERIMLNFLQRLSGVSTETAKYVEALGDSPTKLLDTRKTTPGLRVLEKYAVKMGGDRQELHEKIRTHSMAAGKLVKEEGKANDLLDRIAADPAFNISKEALQKVMKPENYVGRAPEQTEEFLNGVIKPILAENKDALGMHAEINV